VPILQVGTVVAVLAGMLVLSVAFAADIGWMQTNIVRTSTADGSTSTCRADFTNGDRADVSSVCKYGPLDIVGWATWTCECEYVFKDGSRFFLIFKGHNEPNGRVSNASATFSGGTGRFNSMAGSALGVGYAGKMQWNGAYSADADKQAR
jgi:hypothetical protein